MKIKYIFTVLIAAIGLLAASCSDDKELGAAVGIQASQSTVSIPVEGGSATIDVTSQGDWKIMTKDQKGVAKDSIPKWLTVTPPQGGAGTTTVTMSAEATQGANNSTIMLVSGSNIQYVNIIQGVLNPPFSTCAEVLAGNDGDTYKVKGTMTKISSTVYGNWYIKDETGEVYIYGTLDANGATKNFASLGLEEGDEVTIQGPRSTHQGTIEMVDVTVLSYTKSLVKVESIDKNDLPKEGGEFKVNLTLKGEGVNVSIPEEDQDWLSIKGIDINGTEAVITLKAAANEKGARTSNISITSSKGSQTSTVTATLNQQGSIVDCNIADFNAAAVGTTLYRLTGVITKVEDAAAGKFYIKDASGEVYVYKNTEFKDKNLKVGDIVTLTGTKSEYNGVGQVVNSEIVDTKAVTKISVADFLTKADDNDVYYMLEGTIEEYEGQKLDLATYGNFGIKDATGSAYVYGLTTGWGGEKKQAGTLNLSKGDKIIIIGYHSSHNGAPQVGGAFVFSPKE